MQQYKPQETYNWDYEYQIKPTFKLAWGLLWRMTLIQLIIAIPVMIIITIMNLM